MAHILLGLSPHNWQRASLVSEESKEAGYNRMSVICINQTSTDLDITSFSRCSTKGVRKSNWKRWFVEIDNFFYYTVKFYLKRKKKR